MARKLHYKVEKVEQMKVDGGVPTTAFTNFALLDGNAVSLRVLQVFKIEDGQGSNTLRKFVEKNMLES
jgi:hypothetical protein